MTISKDKKVSIKYILKDAEGEIIDSSEDTEPLEYIHGNGHLIPGLEAALEGKSAGEKLSVAVAPEDAYGEREEELVFPVPRSNFDGTEIEVGMQFEAASSEGSHVVTVVEVNDEQVTVDANHPLAGETLYFDVEIVDVRDATPEELESLNQPSCGCGCGGDDDDDCDCGSGGCGCGCDNNNNNCCDWLIWILLLSCFCGNNNSCGCNRC